MFYDVLKNKYEDKIKLCYTDTDSYVLHVETEDVFKDFREMKEHFDFSGYPKDHPNYDNTNAKTLGKFKDEVDGKIISESIHLKPKMYCMEVLKKEDDPEIKRRAKGIPTRAVVKKYGINEYRKTLYEDFKEYISFNTIRSINHEVFSISCNKLGLSNFDNKRYYLNRVESLAHGHYKIKQP